MSESPLERRVRDPGYTPRARDLPALFALLDEADDELARHVERALCRAGGAALELAFARFGPAAPRARARLCALVGRFAPPPGDRAFAWLVERLADPDAKTRRRAISALGRLPPGAPEAPLLSALGARRGLPDDRALAFSLGNVGGPAAREALASLPAQDPELARLVAEALRKIDARALRVEGGAIALDAAPEAPLPALLHVRAGLEPLLLEELGDPSARVVGRGRVSTTVRGPLSAVFAARTFLHVGFPLPPETAGERGAAAAAARALASDAAWSVLRAFTRGPIRYRLEWGDRGRTRSQTARVAEAVAARRPAVHNDSRDALWEVVVTERRGRVFVELWPKVRDPRFVYRRRTLPASSHPTIAAALARAGGASPEDVVWDPFVGSGIELCERALLGPFRSLLGTDLSAEALAAARENLDAAGVTAATLELSDARRVRLPPHLSLVVTNPPFGRRVLQKDAIGPLLAAVLDNAARSLITGGRLVWISPLGDETVAMAQALRFRPTLRARVDVGGIDAELQRFVFG